MYIIFMNTFQIHHLLVWRCTLSCLWPHRSKLMYMEDKIFKFVNKFLSTSLITHIDYVAIITIIISIILFVCSVAQPDKVNERKNLSPEGSNFSDYWPNLMSNGYHDTYIIHNWVNVITLQAFKLIYMFPFWVWDNFIMQTSGYIQGPISTFAWHDSRSILIGEEYKFADTFNT
jgi:hypothetical protein